MDAFWELARPPRADDGAIGEIWDAARYRALAEYELTLEFRYALSKGYLAYLRGHMTDRFDEPERTWWMQQGVKSAEAAVALAPESVAAHYVAGIACGECGRHGDAVRHLSKVPRASRLRAPALRALARAYETMATGHTKTRLGNVLKVDADPRFFLLRDGQRATQEKRDEWGRKAKECAAEAATLLNGKPEANLMTQDFPNYLEQVTVDELNWTTVHAVMSRVGKAPSRVSQKVELLRGRSPSWVGRAMSWVYPGGTEPAVIAGAVARCVASVKGAAGAPDDPGRTGLLAIHIDCMGTCSLDAVVSDSDALRDSFLLGAHEKRWDLQRFDVEDASDGLRSVKARLTINHHGVRAEEKLKLEKLAVLKDDSSQRAALAIAEAERGSEIVLKRVEETGVNAIFRPVKLLEFDVAARGEINRIIAFLKAIESSPEPVVCRNLSLTYNNDWTYSLKATFVFLYRREVKLLGETPTTSTASSKSSVHTWR